MPTSSIGLVPLQAPASSVSPSSTTAKSALSGLSTIWTRTVASVGSLVKLTWRCACHGIGAISTEVSAVVMQGWTLATSCSRAKNPAKASGTIDTRILRRNMTGNSARNRTGD